MTVRELINALISYPENTKIIIPCDCLGDKLDDLGAVENEYIYREGKDITLLDRYEDGSEDEENVMVLWPGCM